ncbi:MAG: hypothetical protein PHP64_00900 [Actinomycetota bacterium]|nr:hypothetical protein [Actinomycetota bacterium]
MMFVSTAEFTSCCGCLSSLLEVGEPLVSLLSEHSVSFSELVDFQDISPSDVTIVWGCIGDEEDERIANEVSRMSKKIIAAGSCAVYGGISARMQQLPSKERVPSSLSRFEPVDAYIPVDLYVPGCPPPGRILFEALKGTLEDYTPIHYDYTVCSECKRKCEKKHTGRWFKRNERIPVEGICFLDQGFLCMGPVTRGGCHASCTSRGAACIGCRGPSDTVLLSHLHSLYSDMLHYISISTTGKRAKPEKTLEEYIDLLYLFTLRDPVTKERPRERLPRTKEEK